jgi:PAS domain-containing protein
MKTPFFEVMHPEDIPVMRDHLNKMKTISNDDKIVEIEYRLKSAKGKYEWFLDRNSVFERDKRNIPVEKIGICQNISAKKQQEETTRTIQSIIQQAEQIIDIGSWEYVIETGEFKWSEGMYKLFNIDRHEKITPEIYLDFSTEEEKPIVASMVNKICCDYLPFEETFTLVRSEGEKRIIKVKAVVQEDKDKKPVKIVGVDLDITDQVKSHEEILKLNDLMGKKNEEMLELNKELITFNKVAAYDYKETFQQMYTNLEYIISKDARNLSESGKANIRRAQSAIQKMNLLTDDINNYLSLYDTVPQKTKIDLNAIVDKVLNILNSKIESTGANFDRAELPLLWGDPILITRLILNLVDNAIKFSKMVTPPVIKIRHSMADEISNVHLARKNIPYFILTISDNGIGFTDEEAEKIFDLFYRVNSEVKHRGSGIGLSVCKKIMSLHDGFITAEGKPAIGASFSCYFPILKN